MTSEAKREIPRLAILIGSPHGNEMGMHNDLAAMYDALRARGLESHEILMLEGNLNRQILTGMLDNVGDRVVSWRCGKIFFYFSGHGFHSGDVLEEARVGVQFTGEPSGSKNYLYWDEIFSAMRAPSDVTVILLPDH